MSDKLRAAAVALVLIAVAIGLLAWGVVMSGVVNA